MVRARAEIPARRNADLAGSSGRRAVLACTLVCSMMAAGPALAWDAHGHRTITTAALDALPADMPAWLREPATRERIIWQSNEPDRWRGTKLPTLAHENNPEHYIDVEDLAPFGLTLATVPPLRYEYLRALAVAKHVHPEQFEPVDAAKDEEKTKEWPGFLPHAIAEHYAKLVAAFNQVRILERLNDAARGEELAQARADAIYHMGILSHFVGDTAQPLHTTRHHHGWVGPNPNGYTTERGFHSFIDGGVLRLHAISVETLAGRVKCERAIEIKDPWKDILGHIQRSFDKLEPLYQLEKNGELKQAAGKEFIVERLSDGASQLSSMYRAAYQASEPTEQQNKDYVRYDDNARRGGGADSGAAASRPAAGGG